jgi:hypothetical protein
MFINFFSRGFELLSGGKDLGGGFSGVGLSSIIPFFKALGLVLAHFFKIQGLMGLIKAEYGSIYILDTPM